MIDRRERTTHRIPATDGNYFSSQTVVTFTDPNSLAGFSAHAAVKVTPEFMEDAVAPEQFIESILREQT